jgi:hypothetical protein
MRGWKSVVLVALVAWAMAMPAAAQVSTGRIELTVVDSTGAVLPGALVELTGPQAGSATTGADGSARFMNLPPGVYTVKSALQGFGEYLNKNVPVVAGGTVQLKATMAVGGVQQQVEVTAATPVIDAKKTGASTSVTLEELQNIPSARDPWVVLQTVPGIIVDRVNVGGSESGQQSNYQAKGATSGDSTWNMDGIPITDMAATGATPMYYDFDMFQEMNVSTGGSDLTSSTGGVALNFILRSGTDTPHGSARYYFENESMQSNNMPADLAASIGGTSGKGNRTEKYTDYGFELGGPLLKGKLWAWGSVGRTDVTIRTLTDVADRTLLKNYSLKLQAQVTPNMRASFTYFYGDKNKWGRGASATRPDETTYNQTGPTPFYKGEVNYVLGNNLFLTGRFAYIGNKFTLTPRGGMDKSVYVDDSGVWHNSAWFYSTQRPGYVAMAEGSYFRGKHEMKFGYSWRKVSVDSYSTLPGNNIQTYWDGYPSLIAVVWSDAKLIANANYQSLWFGDTWTMNRMTLNMGVRYDHQSDGLDAYAEKGNPASPYLPPLSTEARPGLINWNSLSPRVSMTYALNESRKTQARASYAMFASQLGNGRSSIVSDVPYYRYIYYYPTDKNGNKIADLSEIDQQDYGYYYGFDITNPKAKSANKIGDTSVPKTHEIILGVDHELFKNFGVSASFTYRYFNSFNWTPYIGVRSTNYVKGGSFTATGLPDGSTVTTPFYVLNTTGVPQKTLDAGAQEYISRDGYHQKFVGFDVTATKRLADKWMARVGFSTNEHREYIDNAATALGDPTSGPRSPNIDGGIVISYSSGSGKSGIYQLLPKYQFMANGLYQAPWGIDLGMNLVMRQGFGQPWYRSRVSGSSDALSGTKSVLLNMDVGENRLPTVTTMDVRIGWNAAKALGISKVGINVDFDIFNLTNSATVLGRQYDYRLTGSTGFNKTLEIMNPRIARIGVRFNF